MGLAKGEYIGFVDADDWIDEAYFERLYSSAIHAGTDMAKASAVAIYPDGSRKSFSNLNSEIQTRKEKRKPLAACFTYEFWTAIYRRSMLLHHHIVFPDIRNGEDLVFLMQACSIGSGIVIVPGVHYFYRQHDSSTEAVRDESYYESILQAGKEMLGFISRHDYEAWDRTIMAGHVVRLMTSRIKEIQDLAGMEIYSGTYSEQCLKVILDAEIPGLNMLQIISEGYQVARRRDELKTSYSYKLGRLLVSLFTG